MDSFLDNLFSNSSKPEQLPPVGYRGKTHCIFCKQEFTSQNVYSKMGWRETQISGSCEKCFDEICADPDE